MTNGIILINEKNFKILSKLKKLKLLHETLSTEEKLNNFLSQNRNDKLKFLVKLVNAFEPLLYGLFNEEEKLTKNGL